MTLRLLPLLLLATVVAGGTAAPAERGPLIVAGANDAAWQPLFTALAGKGTIFSLFTERRWFSFRKEPIILEGEMRLAPGRGLSLRYLQPEPSVVIVDERGLLIRDAAGHSRAAPADPRAARLNAVLLPILRFDQGGFAKIFALHAAREGADWRLDFVPHDPEIARQLGSVVLFGVDEALRRIEFRRSDTQRVEILIGETSTGVTFGPAEMQRFFR